MYAKSPVGIAPPNTYVNSKTNIIGDMVLKNSSSGERWYLLRLRHVIMAVSPTIHLSSLPSAPNIRLSIEV